MTQVLQFDAKHKNNVIVSHIGNNEYLIEGNVPEAKFIAETTGPNLYAVDMIDGPKIVVGKDFFGKGCVNNIFLLRMDPTEPLLLKIRLEDTI